MQGPASLPDFPALVSPVPCEALSSPFCGGVTMAAPANSTSGSVTAEPRAFLREGAESKLLWLPTPCLLQDCRLKSDSEFWKWFRGGDGGHERAPSSRGECSAESGAWREEEEDVRRL